MVIVIDREVHISTRWQALAHEPALAVEQPGDQRLSRSCTPVLAAAVQREAMVDAEIPRAVGRRWPSLVDFIERVLELARALA